MRRGTRRTECRVYGGTRVKRHLSSAYRRAVRLGRSFATALAPGPQRGYARAYLDYLTGEADDEPEAADWPGLAPEEAAMARDFLRAVMYRADEEYLRRGG